MTQQTSTIYPSPSYILINVLIIVGTMSLGCGCKFQTGQPSPTDRAISGGTIKVAMPHQELALQPTNADGIKSNFLLHQIFEGLAEENSGSLQAGPLVSEIIYLENGKRLVFMLKKDVRFSNGTLLDGESLQKWLDMAMQQGLPLEYHPDQHSLSISASDPSATLKALSNDNMLIYNNFSGITLGTGPFKKQKNELTLARNEYYHVDNLPRLDRIVVELYEDVHKINNQFKNGAVDLWLFDAYKYDQAKAAIEQETFPGACVGSIGDSLVTFGIFHNIDTAEVAYISYITNSSSQTYWWSGMRYELDSIQNPVYQLDSISTVKIDSNYFSYQLLNRIQKQGLPKRTLSNGEIHIFTMPIREFVSPEKAAKDFAVNNNLKGDQGYVVIFNYWPGKIVNQYYVKNIDYFNNRKIPLKKIYFEKAELLN